MVAATEHHREEQCYPYYTCPPPLPLCSMCVFVTVTHKLGRRMNRGQAGTRASALKQSRGKKLLSLSWQCGSLGLLHMKLSLSECKLLFFF